MKKLVHDRKTLCFVLSIMIVAVFTLSVAYAAMSAVLEIHGNSEVVASSWDIHLENAILKEGSVRGSSNGPDISGDNYVRFNVEMSTPGDFFEFTVDVVNAGTIDAMIDDIIKTPELTSEQLKYIKYEVSYENGESINNRQILRKGTTTSIKVRIEYRNDISVSDLPSARTELNLGLKLIYVQSDGTGSDVLGGGKLLVRVVSGDGTEVGNEVCIGEECFYVISSDDDSITMLSKYNLHVGNTYDDDNGVVPLSNPTGIQSSKAIGLFSGYSKVNPIVGNILFSNSNYWSDSINSSPTYIYNSNSNLYTHVEEYKNYLETLGVILNEARLISYNELVKLGCSSDYYSCIEAPVWIYDTSYWTGSALWDCDVWYVLTDSSFSDYTDKVKNKIGLRPVIVISRDYL